MIDQNPQAEDRSEPAGAKIGDMIVRESLTPLVVLDLIAHGEIGLVVRGLSAVTKIDQLTIEALLLDRGWIGLRTIFRAAGFELRHLRAVLVALDLWREVGGGIMLTERRQHAQRCLSRFLTRAEHLPAEEIDEVMSLYSELRGADLRPSAHQLG